ncbi:MAG: molybdopterin-dependent oxidoreductase [Acidobacteriia bacterium]|nr:molybdopterin-dependent oxidoreductase [Terriglobia bacterium]
MDRRRFMTAAAAAATVPGVRAASEGRILLPTDTPDELGFRIMWYNPGRPIDKSTYRLEVDGLVEKPQRFDLGRLRSYPRVEQSTRLKCVQCWSARTTWGGFRFDELLEDVKPLTKAKSVRIDCADKWYEYMSLDEMAEPGVMLCLEMAGQPLTDQHGAPLRLLAPSKYGYKSAKLVTKITFVEKGGGSMACDIGPYYSPSGDILPGYDHPLDLGPNLRKKIPGGEIVAY